MRFYDDENLNLSIKGKIMLKKIKGALKNLWSEYDKFCRELGFDKGRTCRCAPIVKFDQDPELKEKPEAKQEQKEF